MKIINSLSTIYFERLPFLTRLKEKVDQLIGSNKKNTWHYCSRIKSEESFALKVETGRVRDPKNLEDFLGCTLVVENIKEINNAIQFIETLFEVKEKRPPNEGITSKDSFSFQFDDLRLYVTQKKIGYLPNDNISNIVFEVQIKTFLQHAWSIATHDLIYKTDKVSWPKERVAYQIKAMLEQAEISISGAESLSQLPELAKENKESILLNEIKLFLTQTFHSELLPSDMLRLSKIVFDVLRIFKIDILKLKFFIDTETSLNRGVTTLNLSPYCIIIQSIINQDPNLVQLSLERYNGKGIFIPPEIIVDKIKVKKLSKLITLNSD